MNQLDGCVYKCASVDTCNVCVTLFFFFGENNLYLYIHSYNIHMCCTRYQLMLQLPEFVIMGPISQYLMSVDNISKVHHCES